jgi:cytosine/adenosine deaminase-related metal-dependent hydrolase
MIGNNKQSVKLIKCNSLFDGTGEKRDCHIGFEGDEIKYVGGKNSRPEKEGRRDIDGMIEGKNYVVTPAFIDSHRHIGMVNQASLAKKRRPMNK